MTLNLVLTIILIIVLVSFPIFRLIVLLKRRAELLVMEMKNEIANSREKIVLDVQSGSFRGAKKEFGRVKCDGVIAMTENRIMFRKLLGGKLEIAIKQIESASLEKWFLRSYRGGMTHLVVHTKDGNEIGFFVKDNDRWMGEIERLVTKSQR